jgi:branched-chain amino acid aminotransferase
MAENRPLIWLNGALVPAAEARIDPADRGLTLGDGLFETIRAENGVAQHAQLHLARLRQGAAILGIGVPLEDPKILTAFTEMLAANHLTAPAVLRLTLTRGPAPRGLTPPANPHPTLLITAATLTVAPETIAAIICRSTRRNEFSPLARIKTLNALDNVLARNEAIDRGAADAILLNTQNTVAEASAANLFLLKGGTWLTPPLPDGALPGVFRSLVLARQAAFEARIAEADLFTAQSLCLGNALGVQAVASLDGQPIEMQADAITALRNILRPGKT